MTPARSIFRSIWSHLLHNYGVIVYASAVYGGLAAESMWTEFERDVLYLLLWSDLIAAASLRYKAIRQPTKMPSQERTTLPQVVLANRWYAEHAAVTQPIIEDRAVLIAANERKYLDKKENAIAQMVRPANFKEDYIPLWRLERMRRDEVGQIVNLSDQIELAKPEINDAFTHCHFFSREDARVRPTHRAMHGFAASRSFKYWPIITPPCGFSCRCYLRYIARHEAIDKGWLTKSGRVLMEVLWPNSISEKNFKERKFPEWRDPRPWTWPGDMRKAA
jgi:hypothetical protein